MFVFLSRYVVFNILTIVVCAAAGLFFAWLVSVHVTLLEVRMNCRRVSVKAGSNVTLEDVAVLGECCPSGRDSSFDSPYLGFCLWCCISVPEKRSFQLFSI